ncbi:WD40-repeat-containing domain protein [Triangularia setosa]|uniref:WD40-repeat-containing domain protein n=1 Tax=Triangularia setosa TaxID=2587417 RepID=A0AAN6W2X7_9PEZI|nr:WD40-repeat-containing domain protein [Podospora setosa]
MDDDYASSENEADELMEEAEDIEPDNDAEDDNENDDDEQDEEEEPEGDAEAEPEPEPEAENEPYNNSQSGPDGQTRDQGTRRASAASGSGLAGAKYRPMIRPEYTTAAFYDIVPTMAAPQATSINAIAITPDQRYWMTGGSDGYVRKYDGIGTINGKQQLTVAQRHPFVDSVVKSGILMGYWGNEEPMPPGARAEEAVLSPVYSLAVHSEALWLLSGLESGGINLYSVRHDEGKRIVCLREGGHANAVSVLQLAADEKSVLSGSWDKTCLDWDLNNGQVVRRFDGSGGQISAIELRPTGAAPIPAEASEVMIQSDTFQSNNDKPPIGNFYSTAPGGGVMGANAIAQPDGADNPGSPEHESLFGSPAGSLFGDNDTIGGGGGAFGDDDDNEFSRAMDMEMNNRSNNGMGQAADFSIDDVNMSNAPPLDATTDSIQKGIDTGPIDVNTASETAPPPTQKGTTTTNPPDVNTISEASSHTLQGNNLDESITMSLDFSTTDAPPLPPTQNTDTSLPDAPDSSAQQPPPQSPTILFTTSTAQDPSTSSPSTFLSASIDGTLRIWDKRVPDPVARINNRRGVPPWCMGACWSLSGNEIYCGRRNGTVEEFSIHKASPSWQPERVLKLPNGSGAVSAVRPMPNGRHIICASHDILRLYDLQHDTDLKAQKHSKVPFTIVPGPPRAGVISCLYIDPTSRVMISAAGTRGWDGTSTEVLVGYEIHANN